MTAENICIHSEGPDDHDAIDAVLSRSFGDMDVPNLVRMLRQRQPEFDTSLSICASDGHTIVGYAAFIPFNMRFMGSTISALAVAPVGVVPEYQGKGIAGMILNHGHERAGQRGCQLVCLNGHPEYYPRHGYRPCFGFAQTVVDQDKLPQPALEMEAWPVRDQDLQWLLECDEREWHDVDFSWPRNSLMSEWAIEGISGVMWKTKDGKRAAYSLNRAGQRSPNIELEILVGEDPGLVREVILAMRPRKIQNHPAGWLAKKVLNKTWAKCEANRSEAAMAFPLVEGVLDDYMTALEAKQREPGTINWPIPFMMC